jgi:hypothetical protein
VKPFFTPPGALACLLLLLLLLLLGLEVGLAAAAAAAAAAEPGAGGCWVTFIDQLLSKCCRARVMLAEGL